MYRSLAGSLGNSGRIPLHPGQFFGFPVPLPSTGIGPRVSPSQAGQPMEQPFENQKQACPPAPARWWFCAPLQQSAAAAAAAAAAQYQHQHQQH